MRFDSEAYDKIFPRQKPVESVETVVDSFKPTEEEQKANSPEPAPVEPPVEIEGDGQEGDSDGD